MPLRSASAPRHAASVQPFESNADVLRRAMAVENAGAMTEGVEADGGLLVPQDIQTRINELRRSLVPLSDLFAVENVSFLSGSRVVDTAPNKGLYQDRRDG